jgi:pyridoxamine 5'-phosphate oxidase
VCTDPPPETIAAASNPGLDEARAPADPLDLFRVWVEAALLSDLDVATTMALATADPAGHPSARMVLLKGFDDRGLTFYTNYGSRKGGELESNPFAALVFYWPNAHRQVRLEGPVARVPPAESDAYFATRPRGSQIGALASRQSEPLEGRGPLDERFFTLSSELEGRQVPRPPDWGGYRLDPRRIEFWQGRPDRLHDRLLYVRGEGGWARTRLAP